MEKKAKDMSTAERKAAGINKHGKPRKHAEVKHVGASGIKEFTCGHRGKGKYCHTCANIKDGILKQDEVKETFYVPTEHVSYRQMAQYVRNEMPNENFMGMNKTDTIDLYLRLKGVTLSTLKQRMGDQGVEKLKKHFQGR